jgi:hypothetical protein
MFSIGDQVSKVNVGGKVGSAKAYEVATVALVADLDKWTASGFENETAVYTLRKIGGKGKGGCYYGESQLIAAN